MNNVCLIDPNASDKISHIIANRCCVNLFVVYIALLKIVVLSLHELLKMRVINPRSNVLDYVVLGINKSSTSQ